MADKQGITLDRYLKAKGPLPAMQVARLGCQLAQAMAQESQSAEGNRAPVVHPGRILVSGGGSVQLLPTEVEDLALPVVAGFPAYASPEEIRGQPGDFRSSLYSLGCTIFELLTGSPPFSGPTPKETLRAHLNDPVPDPRQLAVDVDDALAETVRELLYKDPELRVQSAAELVRRLKQSTAPPGPAAPQAAAGRAVGRPTGGQARAAGTPAGVRRGGRPPLGASRLAGRHGAGSRTGRAGTGRGGRQDNGRRRGGRLGHGAALRSRGRLPEDEFDDFEEERVVARKKKVYPATYCGLAIGVLLALVFGLKRIHDTKSLPGLEKEIRAEETFKAVKQRKQLFGQLLTSHVAAVEDIAKKARAIVDDPDPEFTPGLRLAALEKLMGMNEGEYTVCSLPGSLEIAAEFDRLLASAGDSDTFPGGSPAVGETSESGGGNDGFEAYKSEFDRLVREDRWGDALDKIREAERKYLASHGKQIDELFFDLEKRLYDRWERDKKEALRLAGEGEVDKALEILAKAAVYGNYEIKQDARAHDKEIQRQALVAKKDGGGEEEPPQDEGFGDLDAEFEKGLKDNDGGSGSGKSEDDEADEGL